MKIKTKSPMTVRRTKALSKARTGITWALQSDLKSVPTPSGPNDDAAKIFVQVALHPTVQAVNTIQSYRKAMDGTSLDLEALAEELGKQVMAANDGNLARAEAMLFAQAHSLDAIFGNLARRAAAQEFLPQIDCLLRLALKAQTQCRATLETLAVIKNPPNVAFVRQANIAHGLQQVNNGIPAIEGSRARELESEQSKLSGGGNELRSDTGASTSAGRIDSRLAAVGTVNRAANARRKG